MNSIDGQLVMKDLYETEYGIYDHLSGSKNRPLASVAMHDMEDINDGSLLEEAANKYISKGIYDAFHLTLLEFLELPIDVIELLFSICDSEQSKKSKAISDISKEFRK
jgi:hypothetical protein